MWQIEGNSMIVSGYSNSSVCATNLQTEAKMENVNKKIINLLSALFTLGSRFKECIVLVFNWQILDTCLYNH